MAASEEHNLLHNAVARNGAVVLSLPSAGMFRHCKSRFLGEKDDQLLIEATRDEGPLVNSLISSGEECVVTFKDGVNRIAFAAGIVGLISGWAINGDSVADALVLASPTDIKTLQRRAHYRAKVPEYFPVRVRVWRIDSRAFLKDTPSHKQEIGCALRDLSVGGIGVRLYSKEDDVMPTIGLADRLRIEITAGEESFILEGAMRQPRGEPSDRCIITGIGFKKLEDDLEGRRILAQLNRIVGDLQREELRQNRFGLAAAS